MSSLENISWTIPAVLVLIGVMIMIHEAGHYWAARYFDVRVESFSFGFGPRLFGFRSRNGETDFRVSAIPLGGYVKMSGEQPGEETAVDDPRSFLAKPRWQRMIIAFAGPFMNIILAVAILTGLYMNKYPKPADANGMVGLVMPGSAGAKAGIREGDRVVEFDGKTNPAWDDILLKEIISAGQPLRVVVRRGDQDVALTVTPELDARAGVGTIGWAEQAEIQIYSVEKGMDAEKQGLRKGDLLLFANGQPIRSGQRLREIVRASQGKPVEIDFERDGVKRSITVQPALKDAGDGQTAWRIGVTPQPRVQYTRLGFADALTESVNSNLKSATMIYAFISRMIEGRMSPKSLDGPLRIAQMSGDAAREGADVYLGLMAMVSLNLAVFNLLPIPILDGGVMLMLLVEMVARRDLSLKIKESVLKFGFVFLMMLVVFVFYNDISKMITRS